MRRIRYVVATTWDGYIAAPGGEADWIIMDPWADRVAWIMDPSGHVWTIATRLEETTEEVRQDRWHGILGARRPSVHRPPSPIREA